MRQLSDIKEVMPTNPGWVQSGPDSYSFTIESTLSGSTMSGGSFVFKFTNYYVSYADFDTKGYWHNKNGLNELTEGDINYVNTLLPYKYPSDYFEAGDEPFDGQYTDGTLVEAAFNNDDASLIWGAGTWQAEVSHFLIDSNAGGDPREQLAQQLLAFIFNTIHRLDSPDSSIWTGTEFVSAQSLIDASIAAWAGSDAVLQNSLQQLLNALNNNDSLVVIQSGPGPVLY